MAFKMKNPLKQELHIPRSESTSTQKPRTVTLDKCYMTDSKTGKKTEIPCNPNPNSNSSEHTLKDSDKEDLKLIKKHSRGAGGILSHHG